MSAVRRIVGEGLPLSIQVDADIPIGKGLGSSAAASVAGVAAALRLTGEEASPDRVYRQSAELEGHADNVENNRADALAVRARESLRA